MEEQYQLPRPQALALASLVVDLRVTQIANGVLGVHAALPPLGDEKGRRYPREDPIRYERWS
jgi:hypothetical protein